MSDNDDNQGGSGGSGSGSGGRSGGSRTVVKMGNVFYAYGDRGTQSKKNTQQSGKKAWQVVEGSKSDIDTSDQAASDEHELLEELIRDDDLSASEVEALLNYLGILPEALMLGGKGRDALNKGRNREFDRWLRAKRSGKPLSAKDILQGTHRLLPKYQKDQAGRRPGFTPQGPDKGPSSGPSGGTSGGGRH